MTSSESLPREETTKPLSLAHSRMRWLRLVRCTRAALADRVPFAWRAPEELLTLDNTEPEYQRAVQNTENAWKAAQ